MQYELIDRGTHWSCERDGTVFATFDREADPEKLRVGVLAQMTEVAQARLGHPVRWVKIDNGYRFEQAAT